MWRGGVQWPPHAVVVRKAQANCETYAIIEVGFHRVCRPQADIVIAACGKAEMVTGAYIKPGAAVIDVGINAVDDPTSKKGYKLVGNLLHYAAIKCTPLLLLEKKLPSGLNCDVLCTHTERRLVYTYTLFSARCL